MKNNRIVLLISILWEVLLLAFSPVAQAASITDNLPLSVLSADRQESIWNNCRFEKAKIDPRGEIIVSFDVSEEMGILLLTRRDYPTYHLWHMNLDGSVINIFQFENPGEGGVAWDSSDICLFVTRGDIVIKVGCDGTLKEIAKLNDINQKTVKAWDALSFRQIKRVTSGRYELQQKGLFLNYLEYSKLVFIDGSTREETTLYDVSTEANASSAVMTILGIGFAAIVLLVVKDQKERREEKEGGRE